MKTMKHTGKKVLSVFLAVLMIMTAWVFVAPEKATAAADVAPATTYATYHVKLTVKFENIVKSGHVIIYYYPVNADGSLNTSVRGEYILVNSASKYSSTTWTFDTADDSTRRLSTDTSAETGPVQGWPCGVKLGSVSNWGSSTLTLTGLTIGNKSVITNSGSWGASGGSTKEVLYDNTGSGWDGYLDWPVPAVTEVRSAPVAQTITVPKTGSASTTFTATFNDQYGMQWPSSNGMTVALSPAFSGASATISGNTATVTGNMNVFNNTAYNSSNGQIKTVLQMTLGGKIASCDVIFQAPKYNVYLENFAGNIVKTYSNIGYYKQSVTLTDLPANTATAQIAGDDDNHQPYEWPATINGAFNMDDDKTFKEVEANTEKHNYGAWLEAGDNHTRTCSVCGYVQTQGHVKGTGYVTKEETCTENGVMTYDCTVCGKKAIATTVIDNITGHDFSGDYVLHVDGKDGTHYRKCLRCDAYGLGTTENDCEAHKWDTNADNVVNALDGEVVTPATCTTPGLRKYSCSLCDATYTEAIPATGHQNVKKTAAKDVTNICGGDGNAAFWTCSDCGKIYKDEALTDELADTTDADNDGIPDALETKGPDHDFTGAYVSASAGENGKHYRQCTRFAQCGAYGPEEPHTWGDPAVTDATCLKTGKKVYTCTSGCGQTYEEVIEKAAHSMTKIPAVAPECGKAGNNEYYSCSTCGKYYKDEAGTTETTVSAETLSALVHTWTAHHDYDTLKTAADCQNAAVYNNHCDYCKVQLTGASHLYGDPDTVNGHKFDGAIRQNADGTHSYKCTIEGCTEYGNQTDCVYKVVADVASTCHTYGYVTYECENCGHGYSTYKTEYDSTNHEGETEVKDATEATCNTNGYTGDTYCLGCNTKIATGTAIVADKTVHPHENMKDYEAKASTCQTEGWKAYRYCDQCGTYETEKVATAKKSHVFTKYTTNNNGTHTATCDTCDATVATPATDTENCSGGTANCVDKKVCTVCKTAYGSVDSSNHKTVVIKAKVPATCQTEGTEDYRYCEACNTALDEIVKIEKLDHKYGAWSKIAGEDKHTRSCTTCDADVAEVATEIASCSGGTANCVELAKCSTCNSEYGSTNPAVHKTEANTLKDVVAATCQKKGFSGNYRYDCCDAIKVAGKETEKLAHTFNIEVEGSRVDATCIETGKVTFKCSTCDEDVAEAATNTTVLPINPENHASTGTTTVGYKAATCKDDGYTGDKYYTCCYDETKTAEENKKALKEKGTVIKADGKTHSDITKYDAVPATCQKAGNYAYSYCSTCGIYMMNGENVTKDQTVEAKIAHTFTKYDSNGNGTHTATCDTCKAADGEVAKDTKNCSGGSANCTDFAECSTCGGAYGNLEPTIHKTAKTIAKLDPTCQKEGHEVYQHCDACGKDITPKKVINKLAHSFTEWTKVEDKDEHTRSCTTCDKNVAPVVTETEACKGGTATCKAKAECSVCGDEYGALNPANHISAESVFEDRVEATCQAEGNTGNEYYACCYDKDAEDNSAALKKAGEVIPKLNHKFDEFVSGTKATCIAKGTETYKCSTCVETEEVKAETKTVELPIDKNNHASDKVKVIGKVDPTCATEGYTGDQYHECCYDGTKTEAENKNALIRKGYKTPATGEHNLINAVPEYLVEYTKDENGVITGYTAKEDNLTYEQKITYRHADNNWYHVQICKDCGEIVEDACFTYAHTSTCTSTDICEICKGLCSLVNLQKHPEGKLIRIPEVPSTCDNQGTIEHYKCEACGKLFFDAAGQKLVEDMDDLLSEETVDHDINTDVPAKPNTDPNKPGTHVFECNDCDDPIVVDCSGGEATCQSKAKCSVCGQEYGEIDEENHESDEVVIVGEKAATCSEGGYTGDSYYKCCYVEGAEDNSKALKAKGEATPSEPSLHVKKLRNDGDKHTVYCEGCGEEFETVDHNWVAGEVPDTASCTEGYDLIYTCECTATKTESIPAKGHDYTETVTEKAATCTEAGSKTTVKTCKVCGNTETVSETIKALGHDERTIKGVAPTCSTDGTTDYIYCNRCDIVIQNSTKLPATGCEDENHDGYCDDCGTYLRTNEDGTNCNCICHKKNIFMRILYKILKFFWKLFKIEKTCACGTVQHW